MSPIGLVCPRCKQRLYIKPPSGRPACCWESQPAAYSLDGRPCFVYTIIWDDFRIRSLHPPDSETDPRFKLVREAATEASNKEEEEESWIDFLKNDRWFNSSGDFEPED